MLLVIPFLYILLIYVYIRYIFILLYYLKKNSLINGVCFNNINLKFTYSDFRVFVTQITIFKSSRNIRLQDLY